MTKYVADMLAGFSVPLRDTDTAKTPAGENLFQQDRKPSKPLDKARKEEFHTFVAKALF